jgi:hypothetical protein
MATTKGHKYERPCLARWWSGKFIRACQGEAARDHDRCAQHQPDGSRLDRDGQPYKNHVAPLVARGKGR